MEKWIAFILVLYMSSVLKFVVICYSNSSWICQRWSYPEDVQDRWHWLSSSSDMWQVWFDKRGYLIFLSQEEHSSYKRPFSFIFGQYLLPNLHLTHNHIVQLVKHLLVTHNNHLGSPVLKGQSRGST